MAEAKRVYGLYDTGNKYKIPSGDMDEKVKIFIVFEKIDTSKIEIMFQPFRTTAIVLPEAKTIYGDGHTGHKYVTPSAENDEKVGTFEVLASLFTCISAI